MSVVEAGNEASAANVTPPSRGFSAGRLFYWSVRRELWQHRSLVFAPAMIGAFFVAASLLAVFNGTDLIRQLESVDAAKRSQFLSVPLFVSAEVIRFIAFVVAAGFAMTTFYSERRDRSILFWKSLPVSDRIAVAAKVAVALVVVPVIAFVTIVVTDLLAMLIGTVAFASAGAPASLLWADAGLGAVLAGAGAALVFQALWQAPVYGYLMLISSWASRVPVLFVILGPVGAIIIEWYVFGTSWIASAIKARVTDGFASVVASRPDRMHSTYGPSAISDAVAYLSAPALWGGLVLAAAFIAVVIWMRRRAEPG